MSKSRQNMALFDANTLRHELAALSRQPFVEVLAQFLECHPTPAAIQAFAEEHPDRWAQALKSLAHLSGFAEQREVFANILVETREMGDAQLNDELKKAQAKLLELEQGREFSLVSIQDADVEKPPT